MRRRQALHLLAGPVPRTKITGGKAMSGKTRRCFGRAAQALRLAAATAAAHGLVRMGCNLLAPRYVHARRRLYRSLALCAHMEDAVADPIVLHLGA